MTARASPHPQRVPCSARIAGRDPQLPGGWLKARCGSRGTRRSSGRGFRRLGAAISSWPSSATATEQMGCGRPQNPGVAVLDRSESGRHAAGEPPAVLDGRKPRLSRTKPQGWGQPRPVVERSRLDDRELRLLGQQRDDGRNALRAELALTTLAGIGPRGHIRGERVAFDTERSRGTTTKMEKAEPVWRWQSSQWQTAVTRGSPSQR